MNGEPQAVDARPAAATMQRGADTGPMLSVVVIGLNEEARLRQSLEAVFAYRPEAVEMEVIYVDSGSTDRSVAIAQGVPGVRVLHLNSAERSAARARNVGLRYARGRLVQLLDGDSVLQPGWLDLAVRTLKEESDVSCVFGQCIEMNPEQSIYMKVCGLDWHIPPGEYRLCGGNAMWRRAAIAGQGFFDEELRAGEEPDLCYRVRRAGGKIVCIDTPMVTHDLGMRRFADYWRRGVQTGRGYARVAARYWRMQEKLWLREVLSNFAEPLVWALTLLLGWLLGGPWAAGGLLLVLLGVRTARIAFVMRHRKLHLTDTLLYGLHCQFIRLPLAIGQIQAFLGFK